MKRLKTLTKCLVLTLCAQTLSLAADPVFFAPYGMYATGSTVGVDQSYGGAGFLALSAIAPNLFIFGQAAGYHLEDNTSAGSFGTGIRYIDSFAQSLWGVNAFYDFRDSAVSNFHQAGVGFEFMTAIGLGINANVYVPITQSRKTGLNIYDDYIGPYMATCFCESVALTSGNAQVSGLFQLGQGLTFIGGIGPYYINSNKADISEVGVRFSAGLNLNQFFWTNFVVTYDKNYSTNLQGIFGFSIPLNFFRKGSARTTTIDSRSLNPITMMVDRFDMVSLDQRCTYTWNW